MNVFSTLDTSKPVPRDKINYENKKLSIYFVYIHSLQVHCLVRFHIY